uniref:Uncharacterized protein n=1 Tax=uncultured Planctomycetota bacterium TaxID=120965 RepID=H5S874_9BACT|nr:hypothetical protein HGMM_F01A04C07 [uncultured Planctomycetota bacterium]
MQGKMNGRIRRPAAMPAAVRQNQVRLVTRDKAHRIRKPGINRRAESQGVRVLSSKGRRGVARRVSNALPLAAEIRRLLAKSQARPGVVKLAAQLQTSPALNLVRTPAIRRPQISLERSPVPVSPKKSLAGRKQVVANRVKNQATRKPAVANRAISLIGAMRKPAVQERVQHVVKRAALANKVGNRADSKEGSREANKVGNRVDNREGSREANKVGNRADNREGSREANKVGNKADNREGSKEASKVASKEGSRADNRGRRGVPASKTNSSKVFPAANALTMLAITSAVLSNA